MEAEEDDVMAKATEHTKDGLTIGRGRFGEHGKGVGSHAQVVHDGDPIIPRATWNISAAKTLFGLQTYFRIPTEDRLWVPEECVPLFVEKGWKRG
jgi:hypothetical protein